MQSNNDRTDAFEKLSKPGELAWGEFRYHVEWSNDFALIFLFSSYPAITALFIERLRNIYATKGSTVRRIAPKRMESLAEEVLSAIRSSGDASINPDAPIWIDVGGNSSPDWLDACSLMLARLNEYRDALRNTIHCPVIVSLPGGYRQRAREIAPDLWAVRNFSLDLDDINPLFPEPSEVPWDLPTQEISETPSLQNAEAILTEWSRLVSHGSKGRQTLVAGWRATGAALALGDAKEAVRIAKQVEAIARREARTDDYHPDLAKSLNSLAVSCSVVGRHDEALKRAKQAVMIYERLACDRPDQYEEGLAASLITLGNIFAAVGRPDDGLQATERAIKIYERLAQTKPDAYELALARSLNNIGIRYLEAGRRNEALQAAERAREIYERLVQVNQEVYEPDLAKNLINLVHIYSVVGRRDQALKAAELAAGIFDRLVRSSLKTNEPALAILAQSLDNLGGMYRDSGRREEALKLTRRAAAIRESMSIKDDMRVQ